MMQAVDICLSLFKADSLVKPVGGYSLRIACKLNKFHSQGLTFLFNMFLMCLFHVFCCNYEVMLRQKDLNII